MVDSASITDGTVQTSDGGEFNIPEFVGEHPTNYHQIRESFALAMACEDIDAETIREVMYTVDESVVNNEQYLEWTDE